MYDKYLIKSGENLSSIAKKFNTLESTILDINNIPFPDMVREGLEIIVPQNSSNYFEYYTIKQGDSLYQIARKYNINPELLATLNGLNMDDYIYPNQRIMVPKREYSYYITKEGDTINLVCDKFNINRDKLLKENPTIYLAEGQLLVNKR